ncbi:hypothetical protein MCHI_000130 [Candidatus Magnetoovum chiemensis]|nr:hypothetical protein MCHI_000130 [Candidatus Magnetoovum chiemensis]
MARSYHWREIAPPDAGRRGRRALTSVPTLVAPQTPA